MMGVFAEFERAMIRERVVAGLKRAKANGVRLGRRKLDPKIEQRVKLQLAKGTGILKTARMLGVGTGTVHRIKREMICLRKPAARPGGRRGSGLVRAENRS
jgi:DNA invertase Pin-like site-specific DNA recombinase